VVTYVLLCGFPPFNAGNESLTYNILADGAADVKFPSPAWDRITPEAISFIQRLLDQDPISRPSAQEALVDTWLSHELVYGSEQKKANWRGTFLPKHGPDAKKVPAARQVVHVEKQQQNAFHRLLNQRRNRHKHQHQNQKHQKQESNHNTNGSEHRGSRSSSDGGLSTTSSMIQAPTHDNNSSSSHRHRTSRRFGNGQLIDKLFHTNFSGRNNDATSTK